MNSLNWTWAAAACAGTSHLKSNLRLQDAFVCGNVFTDKGNTFYGVISDGAGSASHGGEGASIVCRTISSQIRRALKVKPDLPDADSFYDWLDQARDRIFYAASARGLSPRDFAATMVVIITNGHDTTTAHIGDGAIVIRNMDGNWTTPSWPDHGEFASSTYFVTDENRLNLRVTQRSGEITATAIFSDGIERLALDFRAQEPFDGFFEGMIKPLQASINVGKDAKLCKSLKNYLNSEGINARTDDDKSLILAVRK